MIESLEQCTKVCELSASFPTENKSTLPLAATSSPCTYAVPTAKSVSFSFVVVFYKKGGKKAYYVNFFRSFFSKTKRQIESYRNQFSALKQKALTNDIFKASYLSSISLTQINLPYISPKNFTSQPS